MGKAMLASGMFHSVSQQKKNVLRRQVPSFPETGLILEARESTARND